MTFDPNKPVQTRDGRKARIIATDAAGDYPIVVLVTEDGIEQAAQHRADGTWHASGRHDLINVPERRTVEDCMGLDSDGYLGFRIGQNNVRFTFEGHKLIAAEVIG
jgi:hypothetical protein